MPDHFSALFSNAQLGDVLCKNRIVMAPLTRSRAEQPGDLQGEMHAEYYSQRAGAGLIITEATQISQEGKGYAWTPGIYTDEQIEGWKLTTHAVHEAGGLIFNQLWHVGRISHPCLQKDNALPVAPSAIKPDGKAFVGDHHEDGPMLDFVEPRALETSEIPRLIGDYVHAAECARKAGFDGVEVHGANGYLLDQFLRSSTNRRDDEYGGSQEGRMRLLLEVVEAVIGVWGAGRVGVRLSPEGSMNDISDDDPMGLFPAVAKALSGKGLAYIHVVRQTKGGDDGPMDETWDADSRKIVSAMREAFDEKLLVCGGWAPDDAAQAVTDGEIDLAVFGRAYLANPDLPKRIARNGPYNAPDPDTFYGGGAKGYTDYPTLSEASEQGQSHQMAS